jgi:hypothetical protein
MKGIKIDGWMMDGWTERQGYVDIDKFVGSAVLTTVVTKISIVSYS